MNPVLLLSSTVQNPEFGTTEAFSEAQAKIAESEETVRQTAVKVSKAEARLAVLREVGVDVSRWLEKAQEKARGDKPTSEIGCEWLLYWAIICTHHHTWDNHN